MLVDKQRELELMRAKCAEAVDAKERMAKVYSTNRDLVTRKCALESAVSGKDK